MNEISEFKVVSMEMTNTMILEKSKKASERSGGSGGATH